MGILFFKDIFIIRLQRKEWFRYGDILYNSDSMGIENRIIRLPSMINVRSLTGMDADGGKKIKAGKFIRSSALSKISEEDLNLLYEKYGLRTDVDFRNNVEAETAPDRLYGKPIRYVFDPVTDAKSMGMTHESKQDELSSLTGFVKMQMQKEDRGIAYMSDLYRNFIRKDTALTAYRIFLRECLKPHEGAILFHCSVGKDRAGMGAFFLEKVLGVRDEEILEDYMYTNVEMKEQHARMCDYLQGVLPYPDGCLTYRNLYSVNREFLNALLEEIERRYGSFRQFVSEGLGLSKQDVEELRNLYLE